MIEKRKHVRVIPDSDHPIEIQIMGKNFLDIIYARDISERGVGVFVPYRFEGLNIDLPIQLIITLPQNKCFKADGIIHHSNAELTKKGFFGVEFVHIENGHIEDIKQYVEKRKNEGGGL